MLFAKTDNLKIGMRLAKPIYNRDGVLLYERDSKLTQQGINSVSNFGLIGIYILEPAEPIPPMTEDDLAFEKFQAVTVFAIKDELDNMIKIKKAQKAQKIAEIIIRNYGNLNRRINFVQNLRGTEDYVAKHSLNVAMLCAMMGRVLGLKPNEQLYTVMSALVHDIGKLNMPKAFIGKENMASESERNSIVAYETKGIEIIDYCFIPMPIIKRTVLQAAKVLDDFKQGKRVEARKMFKGAQILIVAETFDTMTAMNNYAAPTSEIAALKYLLNNISFFGEDVVRALITSINFLSEGCCIELSNGEKGLVLARNHADVLKPVILCFSNNKIVDLNYLPKNKKLEIKDAMKTMDNRYVMNREMWKKYVNREETEKEKD